MLKAKKTTTDFTLGCSPCNNHHQEYYTLSSGALSTFIFNCCKVGEHPELHHNEDTNDMPRHLENAETLTATPETPIIPSASTTPPTPPATAAQAQAQAQAPPQGQQQRQTTNNKTTNNINKQPTTNNRRRRPQKQKQQQKTEDAESKTQLVKGKGDCNEDSGQDNHQDKAEDRKTCEDRVQKASMVLRCLQLHPW